MDDKEENEEIDKHDEQEDKYILELASLESSQKINSRIVVDFLVLN